MVNKRQYLLRSEFWAVICIVALSLASYRPGMAQEPARIHADVYRISQDSTVIVPVWIDTAAEGASAFSIELAFDPAVVQVEWVETGPYLGETVFEAENVVDNEAGFVRLAATALGKVSPAAEGVLAYLHLKGIELGITDLAFTSLELGDTQGSPLTARTVDGRLTVLKEGPFQATLDLPPDESVQCYANPSDDAVEITLVPGGAEVVVLGEMAQADDLNAEDIDRWLLLVWHQEEEVEPCWATSQALQIDVDELFDATESTLPLEPEQVDTATEQLETQESSNAADCTVRADRRGVPVRVGPGVNRAVRSSMPLTQDIPVTGWFEDDTGTRWWQILPEDFSAFEADRYWVAAADVVTTGACGIVSQAEPSPVLYAPPTAIPTAIPPAVVVPQQQSAPPIQAPNSVPAPSIAEPPLPEPVCYAINIVIRNEGENQGGGSLVPAPNCAGGKYLAGTQITVQLWGDVDAVYGCGITDYIEEPTAGPFIASEDCTVTVNILI